MQISKRTVVALLTAAALAGSATTAVSALAGSSPGGPGPSPAFGASTLLHTTLAPSVPADPMLHGVTAGSAPWVIKHGELRLRSNGELTVRIEGLIIPALGTAGPVTSVDAALYCGIDTTAAATSPSVPLSQKGDAFIYAHVTLPASCLAPVVLINPNSLPGIYIATSGF
jgi:hypothetical protein